ncbi:hypothetical protein ACSSS7_001313 [Eimeria intestinalis]
MAASLRHVPLKGEEAEPPIFTLSDPPSGSHQLPMQARPRRKNEARLQTVLAIIAVFVFLGALTTCFHLSREKVRGRHEHVGRRLAAGQDDGEEDSEESLLSSILEECLDMEEELGFSPDQTESEENDKLLSEVLKECLEMQEELHMPLTQSPLPEKEQAISQALASLYQIQQARGQLPSQEGPPVWPSLPEEEGALVPHQLQTALWQSSQESLHLIGSQVPSAPPSAGGAGPYVSVEGPLQVSVTSQQEQPDHSKSTAKRKRTMSPAAPGEAKELKKQRGTLVQSHLHAAMGAIQAKPHGGPHSTGTLGQRDGAPQLPPNDFSSPLATAQGAETRPPGPPIASTSHEGEVPMAHAALQQGAAVPETSVAVDSPAVLAGLPPPAPPMAQETHLYFRLPILKPGKISKTFHLGRAFSPIGSPSPHPHLSIIRMLLTRPSITPEEAEELIKSCEELVTCLLRFHTGPVDGRKPSRVAYVLARRFLSLEALFTVIQILGPAMRAELWWSDLVSAIPTEVYFPKPPRKPKVLEGVLLAKRLSSALASLKSGVRPSLEETIAIKRMIFKEGSIELGFSESRWDAWREDDPEDPPAAST